MMESKTGPAADGSPQDRLAAVCNVIDEKLRRRCANLKREIYEKWECSIVQRGGTVGVSAAAPTPQGAPADKSEPSARTVIPPPLPLFTAQVKAQESRAKPPQTGIAAPMMWPFPELAPGRTPTPAPLQPVRPGLAADMQSRDSARLAGASARGEDGVELPLLNRVVYDSVSPPEVPSEGRPSNATTFQDAVAAAERGSGVVGTAGPAQPAGFGVTGVVPALEHWYHPTDSTDETLIFESRFESGNLRRAIQVYKYEYDLILKPDINTSGHTQWFYFCVQNTRAGQRYKFNIINLLKADSLYNQGMQPTVYSKRNNMMYGIGWEHRGEDVCYYQNHVKRRGGYHYTATFTIELPHDNDTVFISHTFPYTYTDLQRYLHKLEQDPVLSSRFRRRVLCQTLAGNNCDLLTITSFASDSAALKIRKGVVVSARVHPGECNASYMMQGFIDYLTGPSLDAKILRDNFVFKIVPMLNPDGVVVGNYRCSLAGVDLNRSWKYPSRKLHPTIWHTKEMIRRLMDDREVVMYVDLHGHSRKKNIFMYGCENKDNWQLHLHERVFPRMLWRNGSTFSYADCNFKVQKSKESTARVVVWRELGLTNSYTLEASFAGVDFGKYKGQHFTALTFQEMGHVFCDTILDYCDPDQVKVMNTLQELRKVTNDSESDSVGSGSGSDTDVTGAARRGGKRGRRTGSGKKGSGSGAGAGSGKASKGRSRSARSSRTNRRSRSRSNRPPRAKSGRARKKGKAEADADTDTPTSRKARGGAASAGQGSVRGNSSARSSPPASGGDSARSPKGKDRRKGRRRRHKNSRQTRISPIRDSVLSRAAGIAAAAAATAAADKVLGKPPPSVDIDDVLRRSAEAVQAAGGRVRSGTGGGASTARTAGSRDSDRRRRRAHGRGGSDAGLSDDVGVGGGTGGSSLSSSHRGLATGASGRSMHRDRDATVRARGAVPLGDTDDGSDGSVSTGAGQLDTGSDLNGDDEQGRYWQRRGTSVTSEVGSTSDAEAVQSEIEADGDDGSIAGRYSRGASPSFMSAGGSRGHLFARSHSRNRGHHGDMAAGEVGGSARPPRPRPPSMGSSSNLPHFRGGVVGGIASESPHAHSRSGSTQSGGSDGSGGGSIHAPEAARTGGSSSSQGNGSHHYDGAGGSSGTGGGGGHGSGRGGRGPASASPSGASVVIAGLGPPPQLGYGTAQQRASEGRLPFIGN